MKQMKKMNRKQQENIVSMFREVQAEVDELRSLVEYKDEIEGDWSSFDLWFIRMLNFLRAKDLLEHWSNNSYDELCDDLALNFIKQGLGEKFFVQGSGSYNFQ